VATRLYRRLHALVSALVTDYMTALRRCLATGRPGPPLLLALSVLAAWWIYVPLHELLHAFGCLLAGGSVTRLELEPVYGAHLLAHIFPFVSAGSEYAGRLSGFDTHGSDLTYLATDAAPFLLTPLVGIPLLRRAAERSGSAHASALWLGMALPVAGAPLFALFGDYFEMGTVLISRAAHVLGHGHAIERWRGDDPGVVLERLEPAGATWLDGVGLGLSWLLGAGLVLLTLWLGRAFANLCVRPGTHR
jgi:hypothetical protein